MTDLHVCANSQLINHRGGKIPSLRIYNSILNFVSMPTLQVFMMKSQLKVLQINPKLEKISEASQQKN